MTEFDRHARALVERVALARGMNPAELLAEQERSLYRLSADRLAETAGDERKRTRAFAQVEACLADLARRDRA